MTITRWLLAALATAVGAAAIGLWFWQTEANYAATHHGSLAPRLQWVGIGLLVLGLSVAALALAVLQLVRERR